ncbi:PadR family transcriptional regulator [Priestia megaterium]|uniref:PadR family transcriptional regulator n=1 Tax=Priestia megaterium TaxID=1404 RepID=UPI0030CA0B9B
MKSKGVILGLLSKKSMSGYDIKLVFQEVFAHFFDGSYGMIYPTLKTLEKEGKIEKEVIVQEGKPNKNKYHITEEGREEFQMYMTQKVDDEILYSDFLLRMYFGEYSSMEQLQQWIVEEINKKEDDIKKLESNYENWKDNLTISQKICLDVGVSSYYAQVRTLKESLEHIEIIVSESKMKSLI